MGGLCTPFRAHPTTTLLSDHVCMSVQGERVESIGFWGGGCCTKESGPEVEASPVLRRVTAPNVEDSSSHQAAGERLDMRSSPVQFCSPGAQDHRRRTAVSSSCADENGILCR